MATVKLTPNYCSVSDSIALTITNEYNMMADTSSTTYATVTNQGRDTTQRYLYLTGFDFSLVPENATVNSFTIRIKGYEKSQSTGTTYQPKICNGTTTLTGTCSSLTTSVKTFAFTGITASWNTIKGYGGNFQIRFCNRRSSKNTTSYLYIYGAEIEVDYTEAATEQLKIKENGQWKNVQDVWKKENGIWVKQTNLQDLFDTDVNYVKG